MHKMQEPYEVYDKAYKALCKRAGNRMLDVSLCGYIVIFGKGDSTNVSVRMNGKYYPISAYASMKGLTTNENIVMSLLEACQQEDVVYHFNSSIDHMILKKNETLENLLVEADLEAIEV